MSFVRYRRNNLKSIKGEIETELQFLLQEVIYDREPCQLKEVGHNIYPNEQINILLEKGRVKSFPN